MTFVAQLESTGISPSLLGRNLVNPTGTIAAERTTGKSPCAKLNRSLMVLSKAFPSFIPGQITI